MIYILSDFLLVLSLYHLHMNFLFKLSYGINILLYPFCFALKTIGKIPLTFFNVPSKDNSPTNIVSSKYDFSLLYNL